MMKLRPRFPFSSERQRCGLQTTEQNSHFHACAVSGPQRVDAGPSLEDRDDVEERDDEDRDRDRDDEAWDELGVDCIGIVMEDGRSQVCGWGWFVCASARGIAAGESGRDRRGREREGESAQPIYTTGTYGS